MMQAKDVEVNYTKKSMHMVGQGQLEGCYSSLVLAGIGSNTSKYSNTNATSKVTEVLQASKDCNMTNKVLTLRADDEGVADGNGKKGNAFSRDVLPMGSDPLSQPHSSTHIIGSAGRVGAAPPPPQTTPPQTRHKKKK